jgi:hypothetical protein
LTADEQNIVAINSSGVFSQFAVPSEFSVQYLAISPDGNKVLIMICRLNRFLLPITQVKIWNLSTKQVESVGRISGFATLLLLIHSRFSSVAQWSPDSHSVMVHQTVLKAGPHPAAENRIFLIKNL